MMGKAASGLIPKRLIMIMHGATGSFQFSDFQTFLAEAQRRGMVGLKGHRTVGGLRASIYNWVSLEDVDALVALIDETGRAA